ncbi:MAG: response regulator [Candidatus Omnitrophica bacterium]|nr:response regulator [Candidatus Omnitrophota bacterium]
MAKETQGYIMLIDDEDAILESLGELLETLGFEVITANGYDNAKKIFDSVEVKRIDVIVSDLKMPGKSGVDVLHYVNEKKLRIPFIFLTGYGTLDTCQEAVREGAFDYVLKPIDNKDKILYPVMHAIEKHRLENKVKEMQKDIIHMAEEHQKILENLLSDVEIKEQVQDKISKILDKWNN